MGLLKKLELGGEALLAGVPIVGQGLMDIKAAGNVIEGGNDILHGQFLDGAARFGEAFTLYEGSKKGSLARIGITAGDEVAEHFTHNAEMKATQANTQTPAQTPSAGSLLSGFGSLGSTRASDMLGIGGTVDRLKKIVDEGFSRGPGG